MWSSDPRSQPPTAALSFLHLSFRPSRLLSFSKHSGTTLTMKEIVDVLSAGSVAVQLTVVGPTGKVLPDAGVQTTMAVPLLSVAVTV
jgi:hypothetical protein